MEDVLLVVGCILAIIWLQRSKKKTTNIPKEKAGDFLQFQRVEADGFIVTEDQRYLYMMQVQPVSFTLKSPTEQKMIWSAFRDFINMMPHPVRIRVESHPYAFDAYFQDLKAKAVEQGEDMTYITELQETFLLAMEEQQVRDRRYFLFLETDHRYLSEAGAGVSNPFINDVLKKSSQNLGDASEVAKQELSNSMRVAQSILHQVGIWTSVLNRDQVLSYIHQSVNRDMASLLSWESMQENVTEPHKRKQSLGKAQFGQKRGDVA